jgi:hypothetical protein
LTIQAAIEQVKETGGTVCLGAGTYTLREPVRIVDARSLRVRGQGWATVLVAAAGGRAIEVGSSIGVTLERLAAVGATPQGAASTVTVRNSMLVSVDDCVVLNLSLADGRGAAIGLEGVLIGAAIERCVLAAHTGVSGGRQAGEAFLATADLRIADNWLWCTHRGVELGRSSIHLAETRIAGNTAWGCREAGLIAEGGTAPPGAFNVRGNFCNVGGTGIVIGVDAARIADNDVRGGGDGGGDGIAFVHGLDPSGLDHCQVLGNRIQGVQGHGIAIRTRVNSGMIKHNIVAGTGGGGIVMEGGGEAGRLVVENNQLFDVSLAANVAGAHAFAMRFLAVGELDVTSNGVHGFAREAAQAASRAAISAIATGTVRIGANRLSGIAPPGGFVGPTAAVDIIPPFRSAAVVDNTIRRRGPDGEDLGIGAWTGVQVRTVAGGAGAGGGGFVAVGDLAVAALGERTFVFTAANAFAIAAAPLGDVAARGNDVAAEASDAAPVLVASSSACRFNGNRVTAPEGRGTPSLIRSARAIVSNNDLRGLSDLDVLRVETLGNTQPAILGNVGTGRILVNGAPLGDPWAPFNPVG